MPTKKTNQTSDVGNISVSISDAFLLHSFSGLGLAASFWIGYNIYSINLISDPVQTLRLLCIVEIPISILLHSFFRQNSKQCSYWKAVVQGVVGLPVGALLMAFGAVVLGAPVGIQYLVKTLYWSFLMSAFTFVPTACIYGSTWKDWQRLFAYTKPIGVLDYIICIPAHGALIGAWLGAWPMPLDWERPWQEWPICVSYGAVVGYMVGMVVSMIFVLILGRGQSHSKRE
ncbi:Phosphatidylinositol-glycan biosynthesis class f protein [Thalictrum thalictroides]|uniref:Phosphatidylinositol-glycan biosynthesis class f protein n=1 Tax=Thalictrum thalictroides TaxID=46969 RepID=A0A7J6W996_THATH|nr:Phosphatidylinositol-glycan biosynthesis class f protein [Thalictrum thalictroides]